MRDRNALQEELEKYKKSEKSYETRTREAEEKASAAEKNAKADAEKAADAEKNADKMAKKMAKADQMAKEGAFKPGAPGFEEALAVLEKARAVELKAKRKGLVQGVRKQVSIVGKKDDDTSWCDLEGGFSLTFSCRFGLIFWSNDLQATGIVAEV